MSPGTGGVPAVLPAPEHPHPAPPHPGEPKAQPWCWQLAPPDNLDKAGVYLRAGLSRGGSARQESAAWTQLEKSPKPNPDLERAGSGSEQHPAGLAICSPRVAGTEPSMRICPFALGLLGWALGLGRFGEDPGD